MNIYQKQLQQAIDLFSLFFNDSWMKAIKDSGCICLVRFQKNPI